jgi:hypothetical protein
LVCSLLPSSPSCFLFPPPPLLILMAHTSQLPPSQPDHCAFWAPTHPDRPIRMHSFHVRPKASEEEMHASTTCRCKHPLHLNQHPQPLMQACTSFDVSVRDTPSDPVLLPTHQPTTWRNGCDRSSHRQTLAPALTLAYPRRVDGARLQSKDEA